MSGALADALERDVEALAGQRFVSVVGAALIAGCHPDTVSKALRSGELHGHQRVKGGTWKIRPACLDAWVEGAACEHQEARVVSLDAARRRLSGERA